MVKLDTLFQDIRTNVANDKIDVVLDEMLNLSRYVSDNSVRNGIILNCSNYKNYYRNNQLDIANNKEQRNKAILFILQIIDELEKDKDLIENFKKHKMYSEEIPKEDVTLTKEQSLFRVTSYDMIADLYDYWYAEHWNSHEPSETILSIVSSYNQSRGNLRKIKILDCACGTGNSFVHFTKKGYDVYGTDGSIEMLQRARKNCLENDVDTSKLITEPLIWNNLQSFNKYFPAETFDLIVITGNSFCHLPLFQNIWKQR